jgi:HAD superfamily phosphoserine phosphatase-like hydrolase
VRPRATAAFFRAEGVLLDRGVVSAAAYMASNRAGFRERAFHLGVAALAAPVHGLLGQTDRTFGNRLAHLAFRKMTEDRVELLAEEYVEDVLKDRILHSGVELLKRAKKAGHRTVVLSEGVSAIMDKLLPHIRHVDELICNRLEIRDGEATGKLEEPVVGGYEGGRWVRDYAREHELDLDRSVAYGAHGPDVLLLAAVGDPCAVNADYALRKAAREAGWALLDYDA